MSTLQRLSHWITTNTPHYLNRLRQSYNLNPRRGCIILATLITITCCCCFTLYAIIYATTPAAKASATARLALTQTAAMFTSTPTRTPTSTKTPIPSATSRPTNTPTHTRTPRPTYTPTNTPIPPPATGFQLINLTQSATPGGSAIASIRTQPGTTCTIVYTLPSGHASIADGLYNQTANSRNECTWYWNIQNNTTPGTGAITITANGQTETYPITIK